VETVDRDASRSSEMSGYGCLYLVLWFVVFIAMVFLADSVLPPLVEALGSAPVPLVVVLGWLPAGAAVLSLTADAARVDRPAMRQPWVAVLAVAGLAIAVELPVVLRRLRFASDEYRAAADTQAGEALVAGAMWPVGLVLLWALLFQTARWLAGRLRGRRVAFRDDSWGTDPRLRRRFAVAAGAAVLLGLGCALATAG
jgi:hypothetical protein